jgi:hypothetical protein
MKSVTEHNLVLVMSSPWLIPLTRSHLLLPFRSGHCNHVILTRLETTSVHIMANFLVVIHRRIFIWEDVSESRHYFFPQRYELTLSTGISRVDPILEDWHMVQSPMCCFKWTYDGRWCPEFRTFYWYAIITIYYVSFPKFLFMLCFLNGTGRSYFLRKNNYITFCFQMF